MDRFLIAPFKTGLQTDLRPWLIMDDAFEDLRNAYVFRGRVRKRFGSRLMTPNPGGSRLRIQVGTTDGSGNISVTVPGNQFNIGQQFTIGLEIFTVYQTGTPAVMLDTGAATVKTFNTTSGALVIHGATINTAVYWYPGLPVMGICNYDVGPINDQPSYAFDTQFAYKFVTNGWLRSGSGTSPLWHGGDSDFFWTYNWRGTTLTAGLLQNQVALFVSNFYAVNPSGASSANDDPIWYTLDGATWSKAKFYFSPTAISAGPYVLTAKLIVAFYGRLILFNTIEQSTDGSTNEQYPQRARFSFYGSPFATNAWYEPNTIDAGGLTGAGAGYIDASTEEQIVGCEFIKDRLIVFFERSTWELAYNGNQVEPFSWQKINTELGSEATFSTVPFDKAVLAIGNTGVHSCNGANVERIDNKIPQEIFDIHDKNEGVYRVAGIRDYFAEMVYWTFPSNDSQPTSIYPNRILVYNYQNGAWAINDDCITAWGYFEQQTDITWADIQNTWEENDNTWNSGVLNAQFRQVLAGNQQGYMFIIDVDQNRNAPVMQITNIAVSGFLITLTIINHTLTDHGPEYGDYILIENVQGLTNINGTIVEIAFIDKDTVSYINLGLPITGAYTGGGTATRVSDINILTKRWNPYISKGNNVYLQRIDFAVEKTELGEITVDYYPSGTQLSMLQAGGEFGTDCLQGNGVLETRPYDPALYPLEQEQYLLWHPIYFQSYGETIQLFIYMTFDQITNPDIALAPFQLEGLVLHTQRSGARLQ